jgi:heptosyltransferase-2
MRRILVVRSGGLGDTLVTLPALRVLRRQYPGASLEVAGNTDYWSLARDLVDRIHHIDDPAIVEIFQGSPRAHFEQKFGNLDLLISWSTREPAVRDGPPTVVSATPYPPPGIHASDWLVQTLTMGGPKPRLHQYGDTGPMTGSNPEGDPLLSMSETHLREAELLLASHGLSRPVLLHPGAGGDWKRWPAERFAELAKELRERDAEVALLAGPADEKAVAEVTQLFRVPVIRDDRLPVVAALLSRSRGYVGNDSGISHLAAAVAATGLALFGPTDPASWAPGGKIRLVRGCQKTTSKQGQIRVCEDSECMSLVTVSDVMTAVEEVIRS